MWRFIKSWWAAAVAAAGLHPAAAVKFSWNLVREFPAGCVSLRYYLLLLVQSVYVRFSPPTRPYIPWLVLLAATSTWRCESRGWHIDTAVRWTPACSRSGSGTWAPGRPAGTRISGGKETNIFLIQEGMSEERQFMQGKVGTRPDGVHSVPLSLQTFSHSEQTNIEKNDDFTENILPRHHQQESVGTSTMVDPQVSRIHAAKKMLRGCGGTEGKTNELMTVTWRRKPDRNVSHYCICLLFRLKRGFGHHMQMSCTFSGVSPSPSKCEKRERKACDPLFWN